MSYHTNTDDYLFGLGIGIAFLALLGIGALMTGCTNEAGARRVLDANDMLDAIEEAEDRANRKAEADAKRNRQSG